MRHRIYALAPVWAAAGVDLTVRPFMTERFYAIRRDFGRWRTAEKLAWFLLCTLRLLWTLSGLRRYDALVIHREVFPLGPPVFERLAARLAPFTAYDLDDALWHRPSNTVDQRRVFADPGRVAKIVDASGHVVAGNGYIAEYAAARGRPVTVVPTSFDDLGGAALHRRPRSPVVVAWIGNVGNAWYLRGVVLLLERLLREHAVTLRLIGGADIAEIRSDTLPIDRRAWSPEEEGRLGEADIGVMPLPDLEYERGKSGFKIIQYWSAGLGVIASPVGVNATLVRHGVDGLLAGTDPDWDASLRSLVADEGARRALAQAGYQRYRTTFSREQAGRTWLGILA